MTDSYAIYTYLRDRGIVSSIDVVLASTPGYIQFGEAHIKASPEAIAYLQEHGLPAQIVPQLVEFWRIQAALEQLWPQHQEDVDLFLSSHPQLKYIRLTGAPIPRDSQTIAILAQQFNLDQDDLDTLFITASAYSV